MSSIHNLFKKEVINICDGSRLGYVCDVIVNSKGCIEQIVVPCSVGLGSIFGKDNRLCIPWCDIVKIGEDIILVSLSRKNTAIGSG